MSTLRLAKYMLCLFLYYSGILFLFRFIRKVRGKHRVVILAYHSFSEKFLYLDMSVPPSIFFEQVGYLCRSFQVKILSKLLTDLASESGISEDVAVITVDDGYEDNFVPLSEIAKKFHARSTVYLTTDCIDLGEPTTVMWIMMAIHHAATSTIHIPEISLDPLFIRTPSEKESAIKIIDGSLKPLSAERRKEIVDLLLDRSGVGEYVRELGKAVMLSWDQINQMHEMGIEFGGHTLTHPVLSLLESKEVHKEISQSIRRIKEMIGIETITFAYPYGGDTDVSDSAVDICRVSGPSAGVMLIEKEDFGNDLFRIPRMMVTSDRSTNPWGGFSKAVWGCELEGLLNAVRRFISDLRRIYRRLIAIKHEVIKRD